MGHEVLPHGQVEVSGDNQIIPKDRMLLTFGAYGHRGFPAPAVMIFLMYAKDRLQMTDEQARTVIIEGAGISEDYYNQLLNMYHQRVSEEETLLTVNNPPVGPGGTVDLDTTTPPSGSTA